MRRSAIVLWPSPRKSAAAKAAAEGHEFMDGLSYLERHGYRVQIVDPFPFPWNPFARTGSLLAGLDAIRSLYLLLRYAKFDVLVSVGCSSAFFFALFRRVLRLKKPLVMIDPHLSDDYPARQRLQKRLLPFVDAVVVFGTAQTTYLERLYSGTVRSHFVPHRLDCAFFRSRQDVKAIRPKRPERRYVLCIGNDAQRDFETLYKAAAGCGVTVLLHTSRSLPANPPENIKVSNGWLSFPELRLLYDEAVAVVLPLRSTVYAGGINSLLEAMAMEKAVIVSDSPGIRDYVSHDSTAWVVPPEDPNALREAISKLIDDHALATRLGANARSFCERECDLPIYAGRIANILDNAIAVQSS